MSRLEKALAEEVHRVLEFHRWGGAAEGVTVGGTVYDCRKGDIREDVHKLQGLCRRVLASCAEQTTPSRPQSAASVASRVTCSAAGEAIPSSCSSRSS